MGHVRSNRQPKTSEQQRLQILEFIKNDVETLYGESWGRSNPNPSSDLTRCKQQAHWFEVVEFAQSIGADFKTVRYDSGILWPHKKATGIKGH